MDTCNDCSGTGEVYAGCHICDEGDYHTKCDSYYRECDCKAHLRMKITNIPSPAHPETHRLVKVESRGRIYACEWAEPFPDGKEIAKTWREERKAFRPYDETTGRFLS